MFRYPPRNDPADPVQVRWATPADQPEMDALYAQVFGAETLAALQLRRAWQYEQNPFARRPDVLVARAAGRVAGQTCGIPVPLLIDGVRQPAAFGCDTLVHAEWRRRGIASQLVEAWETLGEHEVTLGLGSAPFQRQLLLKHGYRTVGQVTGYVWRGTAGPARPGAVSVTSLDPTDERLDRLFTQAGPGFAALVRRDRAWVTWRFARWPAPRYALYGALRDGKLVGYSVLRPTPRQGGTLLLVDWLAHPEDAEALAALLAHACNRSGAQGTTGVFAFASERRLCAALRTAGFQQRPDYAADLLVGGRAGRSMTLPSPDSWHLSLGDSDIDRPP